MKTYLDLLRHVYTTGTDKTYRNGVRRSVFGYQLRHDLAHGFPLLTTKKVHLKSVIGELLWFLTGSTNVNDLHQYGVTIWDEWADETGELGPIYGKQWTAWEGKDGKTVNQIAQAVDLIRNDPNSTRIIVSGWNVADIQELILSHNASPPPCHTMFQFYVSEGKLSCQLYQRSADVFLGVPFNIASYALLTMMIAKVTDLALGEFVHTFGDVHLYQNHFEQAELQLSREPKPLPQMVIHGDQKTIFDFKPEDFEVVGYDPHPGIKAEVSK